MDERDLETLHQEASAHYLQGEYDAALSCWRRVLEAKPQDDRATEGVRLCEQLVDSTSAPGEPGAGDGLAIADPHESETFGDLLDAEADGGDSAISEGMRESLEALDEVLVMDSPRPVGAGGPTTHGNLAEKPDVVSEPAAAQPAQPRSSTGQSNDDVWHWSGGDETTEGADDPVEIELRRRVNELMAEALVAMEQGRLEEALGVLDRLLILDDTNEPALTLQDRIRHQVENQPADERDGGIASFDVEMDPEPEPTVDEDAPGELPGEDGEAPDRVGDPFPNNAAADGESGAFDAPVPIDPAEPDVFPDAADPGPVDCEPLEEDQEGARAGVVLPTATVARRRSPLRTPALAALGVVVIAGLAYAGWSFLGPESSNEPPATALAGADGSNADGTALASLVPSPPPGETQAADPATTGQAVVPSEPQETASGGEIRAAVAEGDDAFEQSNYSAAVVAYDRALRLDPENEAIRARFELAGERYRKHQAHQRQWQQAIRSFEEHDYHTALHTLYRLPADQEAERLNRIKENGWYNYGLIALRAGECREALSRFTEARAVQGGDGGIDEAMRVSRACRSRSAEFATEMSRLEFRSLAD